jgi:GntR family transcriptional repressor for pyruvate dehydrogenase complex
MPFEPVAAERLSQAVVRQIERLILRGILKPGERLPPERELAERLGVSRPSLREAFADLQARGLLAARPGSGVFVAETLGGAFPPALAALFAADDEAAFEVLAFRRDIEGLAAERAARTAGDTDLQVIDAVFRRMEAAHAKRDPSDEAALDATFHLAIVEAGHNLVMLHMMRSMYDLLRQGVVDNRQALFRNRVTRGALLDQHRTINAALQARDPATARSAVEAHIDFIAGHLEQLRRAARNEAVARQRLQRAGP